MKSTDRSGSTHPHDRRIAGRAQGDSIDDPYARRMKPPGPTVCPHCGAVFHEGRWQWMRLPMEANRASCPACQRVHDDYPAGIVSLTGSFVIEHRDELRHRRATHSGRGLRQHLADRVVVRGDAATHHHSEIVHIVARAPGAHTRKGG